MDVGLLGRWRAIHGMRMGGGWYLGGPGVEEKRRVSENTVWGGRRK